MTHIKRAAEFLLILTMLLTTVTAAVAAGSPALTISGDGVEREVSFTLAELKSMTGHISRSAYSAWNTWPTRSVYYAEGVSLTELLSRAGIKDTATTINIAEAPAANGSAGYNMSFLPEDLLAERYTFEGTKAAVPAILAFRQSEKSFATMDDTALRLIYGQLDAQEQTTAGFVKSVSIITVTCGAVRRLPMPEATAELQPGGRYSVTLSSSNVNAKVYYTTDGTTPTVHSKMYNISAPHWQQHLNVPFTVAGDTVVKAVAVATGFADSGVLSFTPASLDSGGGEAPGSASIENFTRVNTYRSGHFTDVNENQWYGYNKDKVIANAYEYDLIKGVNATLFNPAGHITLAEAVTLASRVRSIYAADSESFVQGSPWYQVYVDYAVKNGIIGATDFSDYTRAATRAEMAYIFSRSLPQSEFTGQNTVNSLPDVSSSTQYYDSIITLYKAGIVTGNDESGTFHPGNSISRAEAAAIISRVALPKTRSSGKIFSPSLVTP